MKEEVREKVREIKQSFRLLMNGEASRSMRESGIDYRLNWGVPYTELKKMAGEYGKDFSLALELWKENVRECKILATMIMPAEEMTASLADLWLEQAETQEIAEMLAFNLFQHLDYIPMLAFEWIASSETLHQICGYHVMARLLTQGQMPDDRGIGEIVDQACTALADDHVAVRHAAYNCLQRLAMLGDDYQTVVASALRNAGIDF